MKTVTGKEVSSKSVSLSKAARILSKFASSDNEASPAFSAYLKRAAASFNELVQFHKELKSSGSERKAKKRHSDVAVSERTVETVINRSEDGLIKEIGTSKRKERLAVNKGEEEVRKIDVRLNVDAGTQSVEGSKDSKKNKSNKNERKNREVPADVKNEVQSHPDNQKGSNGQTIGTGKKLGDKQKILNKGHAAVNVVQVKNETENFNESKEMKKMSRLDSQDGFRREATQPVENADDAQRKHKKNKKKHGIKEESISSGIEGVEQRKEQVDIDNLDRGGEQKNHETNRTDEKKERKDKGKLDIEATNKETRKRKYENVAAEALDGSQEKHKSKKKKR